MNFLDQTVVRLSKVCSNKLWISGIQLQKWIKKNLSPLSSRQTFFHKLSDTWDVKLKAILKEVEGNPMQGAKTSLFGIYWWALKLSRKITNSFWYWWHTFDFAWKSLMNSSAIVKHGKKIREKEKNLMKRWTAETT